MATLRLLHILMMMVWVGNLFALTRFMGYHVKLAGPAQLQVAPYYVRMYKFVGLPTMCLTVILGMSLLIVKGEGFQGGWLHLKLTAVMALIVIDLFVGKKVAHLVDHEDHSRGVSYKILHGFCGLFVVVVLFAIYVLKPMGMAG